jgi:TonB family protein
MSIEPRHLPIVTADEIPAKAYNDNMRSSLPALLAIVFLASPGEAQEARIVKGGPASPKASKAVIERVGNLAALRHCWRKDRKGAARVKLRVNNKGVVTESKALSRGAVAQCVAGMMRVFDFPVRGAFTAEIDVLVMGSTPNKIISAGLKRLRPSLDACYERVADTGLSGELLMSFIVKPSGSVLDVAVQRDSLGSKKVSDCLLRTLRGANLGPFAGKRPMTMKLPLRFSGTSKAKASSGSSPAPKKSGPVSGEVITQVVRARFGDFNACYDKYAQKHNGKLAGVVTLRFTIRANGTLRNVKVRETTLNHKKVESCVVKAAKSLKFPAEAGRAETKVFYPLSFSSMRMR